MRPERHSYQVFASAMPNFATLQRPPLGADPATILKESVVSRNRNDTGRPGMAPNPSYGQADLECRSVAARFIHNSNPKFIAEKTRGPYALPGSLRPNPMIASNSWTRIIATASAATPPRDRKAIAYAAANGSATLREAAYRAYSCLSTIRSDIKEKPALTTALKSVNPAQAQYALPTPCGALMS